jgi:hypothetical protein
MNHITTTRLNSTGRGESTYDYGVVDDEHNLQPTAWYEIVERNELRDRIKYREDLMKAEAFKAEDL